MVDVKDFEVMFENNPLPQAVTDASLKIVLVNEAFSWLTGYSRDQLLAMKFSDFRTQNRIKYLKDSGESIDAAVSSRKKTTGETLMETSSGLHAVIRTNIPILDEKGDPRYIYVTYNDVTKLTQQRRYMEREVTELSKVYSQMAAGDLTVRYDLTPPDEDTRDVYEMIIKLRDAVRGIVINLEKNIADVNRQMQRLTATAADANKNIADASQGVNLIAKNAGEVSANTQKAAAGVDQISKAMQDMSAAVEEITSSMESVTNQAKTANESAKDGAVLAGNVNRDMTAITTSAGATYDEVKAIEKQMADISKIITLIRDLANQTNLLALNAAIEAARAGEHGRGFAVVASEVKSLAQESRMSAEKIEEMITHLNTVTKRAADGMEEAKLMVGKGAEGAQKALESFKKIQKAAETVANSASEVAAATEEQAATTEEITASVHEVASLIDHTAKEAGDAAAATEESAAALDEITRMIQNVNDVAVEAMEANRRFKVE